MKDLLRITLVALCLMTFYSGMNSGNFFIAVMGGLPTGILAHLGAIYLQESVF